MRCTPAMILSLYEVTHVLRHELLQTYFDDFKTFFVSRREQESPSEADLAATHPVLRSLEGFETLTVQNHTEDTRTARAVLEHVQQLYTNLQHMCIKGVMDPEMVNNMARFTSLQSIDAEGGWPIAIPQGGRSATQRRSSRDERLSLKIEGRIT
jgi:hypothetical protein